MPYTLLGCASTAAMLQSCSISRLPPMRDVVMHFRVAFLSDSTALYWCTTATERGFLRYPGCSTWNMEELGAEKVKEYKHRFGQELDRSSQKALAYHRHLENIRNAGKYKERVQILCRVVIINSIRTKGWMRDGGTLCTSNKDKDSYKFL